MASLELGRTSIRSYAFEIVNYEIERRLLPLLWSVAGNEDGVLDLQDVFRRFSFDSICRFSFGLDPGCLELSLPISEFADAFDLASKLSAARAMAASPLVWRIKRVLNLGTEKKLRKAIKLINILAQERHRHKLPISWPRHSCFSFNQLLLAVVQPPEGGAAIRSEADKIIGPDQEVTSFEQMQELHYLQAAVHESMRLYPPIQFDSKFCQEDDVLPDGTFVQRGTRVTYHPYAMGRIEGIWGPDCLEFKPERWLKDGVFFPENPFKYPVFQAGIRVCLGKEMALMEFKSVALSLVRRFHIELATPCPIPRFSPGLTATFGSGLPVLVRGRTIT
ncbi:Cytochrome P450 94C1 [Vitis vinifera]|uniref:Cytochrome P450 94C1 n=1 Tax=Vitis vinifera TaxID=29760 RepID=A0A438EK03_VITVI|nr:Cytochrome P450 94C1 [Vitis vinifera]